MTVSVGTGVDIGNIVTSTTNPVTGRSIFSAGENGIVSGNAPVAVLLGDSRTNCYQTTYLLTENTTALSFYAYLNMFLGGRLKMIDAGVSGDTTAAILARFDTDVTPHSPGYVFLHAGINDRGADVSAATTINNIKAIAAKCRKISAVLVLATDSYSTTLLTTSARKAAFFAVNNWIRSHWSATQDVIGIDAETATLNPDGTLVTNATYDGTHQAPLGAYDIARAYYEVLDPVIPKISRYLASNNDHSNLCVNGAFVGDNASGANSFSLGTGGTGTGPSYWNMSRTGSTMVFTSAKAARSDWRKGSIWRGVIATAGANDNRLTVSQTINFRAWASNTFINIYRRIHVAATGAQYDVTIAGTTATGADPTGSWSTEPGAVIVDGGATLVCREPITAGTICQGMFGYTLSGISVGQVTPIMKVQFKDAASATVMQLTGGQYTGTEGSLPAAWPVGSGVCATPDNIPVPAGFDLSTCTGSAGPSVLISAEIWTQNSALATFDLEWIKVAPVAMV